MASILVVDDELEVVSFLKSFLSRKGASVRTATNAREALAAYDTEKPDLMLLDVRMPGEDGFFVLEKIKQAPSQTKIIMVTAREDKPSIIKAKKLGADDYLVKPIELEMLDSIISQYIQTDIN